MRETAPFFSVIALVSIRTNLVDGFPWASGKANSFAVHGTTAVGATIDALLDESTGVKRSSARPGPRVLRKTIIG